ncbi:MAG: DUF1254 domain-containing protein [Methylocystis sp.]|jgi:uncharacterized membrane protein
MNFKDRAIDLLPWAIATLLIAAIVHIVSILLTPLVAPRDAYARLVDAARTARTAPGGVATFEATAPNSQPLPFEDPMMAEGVCLFDLSKGPLHLRTTVDVDGDDYLGISFHSASGVIFHAMTDRASIKGKVDIVVGNAHQIAELEADDSEDAPPQEIRLTAPSSRGFAMIRALAKRPSDYERARSSVEAIVCDIFQPRAP